MVFLLVLESPLSTAKMRSLDYYVVVDLAPIEHYEQGAAFYYYFVSNVGQKLCWQLKLWRREKGNDVFRRQRVPPTTMMTRLMMNSAAT